MRYKTDIFVIVLLSMVVNGNAAAKLLIKVRPQPARIYQLAPPGVAVLTVTGLDEVTGEQMNVFRFSSSIDSSYFQIDSEGVMRTNRTVDRRVGTVFNFFIFGTLQGTIKYKYIEVIVSKENLYPPVFEREFYKVSAYRYLDNKVIVRVVAHDGDAEDYNKDFKYFIPDPPASDLFKINDYGEISLVKAPPDDMKSVSFHVFAINEGSPARTRNTNVTVTFKDFQQADIYCFITGTDYIKLCWKNPMVGRNISGFIVKITGRRNRLDFVPANINTTEVCHVLEQTQVGHYYRYKVNIQGAPDNDLELVLNITGVGFTSECLTSQFNPCNYLNPCNHQGVCIGASDNALQYTCECPKGWRGKNCSEADICIQNPCMNNGQCLFLGHQVYKCICDENFIGKDCQHFNICTMYPCQNGGWCRNEDDGKFSCDCPDYFSGENCEVPDPCQPSPCGGRGLCSRISSTEFMCDCNIGYSGKRCDEINRCLLDSPCMNSGTCLSTSNNTFTCSCTPQTTGRYCEQFNPCSQQPCMNNSTCKAMGDSRYLCECLPGYHGGECQYYDPCRVKTCNNGTCTLTGIGTLHCICQDGYFGESCEFLDPCYGMPCGNGGMCRNISLTEYKCDCFQEWFGEKCENLKSCTLNLCRNNATCLNIPPSSYECICKSGYYGDLCGMYNACYDLPCKNGGECVNNTEGYLCKCLNGYGGQNCEYRDLCSGDPCNEGTCMTVSDNQFACNCSAGYTGELCDVRDYCYENLCKNGGECISTENDFICDCVNDHYGKLCHYLNYCKSEPCNNGTCHLEYKSDDVNDGGPEVEHQEGYTCTCFDGYTGSRCEHRVMDCSNIVCLNGGDCVDSICLCPEGYTGEVCEHVVSPCEPSPCQNNQYCQVSGHRYVCKCVNGAASPDCIKGCTAETTIDKTGQYDWPDTQIIDTAELPCPYGAKDGDNGQATRDCFKQNGKAIWDKPNTSMCAEMGIGDVNQHLDYLKSLTSDPSNMGPEDVTRVADELEKIYQFSLESKSVANNMVTVVSNLADVNMSVMAESNSKSQTSDRLLTILEDYTADVISDNVINLSTSNIDIRALDIVPDKIGNTSIRYEPQLGNKTTERGFSISLPPEIFQKGDRQIVRLQFLGFQKSTFFVPKEENELIMDNASSQRVVTATVKGRKLQNLKQMVSFKMPSIKANANHTCVYWDTVNKTWSSEGVITGTSGNMTECWSSHLTSFAILLDPSPEHALPVIHEEILTYITYIGCAISMVGLILTILTYTLFKCLHGEKSGKILLNLCVAMLLMNLAFLFGSQSSTTYGDDICTAVAVMLHLFLLATLMWMLVEAVEMYQALVTVFNKYARFYMMKRCVVGWGVPLLIVIITLSIDTGHYKPSADFCFISQASPIAYYASLVGPACVILIVNTLVFILVARVILKPRFQQQERGTHTVTPAQIRGAFTVMILLGITWVFGPLAIHGAKLVFNYLFCILNSLQGFLIFVFRCLFNPEARLAWIQLIKTGTLKRRRGPVKSVYSESSSKVESKSRSNGHLNGHSKSNIIQANGWQGNKLNNDCDDSPYLNGHNRRSTKCLNMDFNMENNMLSAKDSVNTEEEYIPDKEMTQRDEDNTHL
ncbi:cadherin EGF LAG seven-pass G-type receptor 2 [Patella vulgata]|uniref:cadherin EGF LAG seven-pass G-type receptor 2 n=1 Tax=Patella vulgata TaxID=6465 RepID=UPI0024A96566|nr:cadherin EGF LAG seven-pass G-type receptor 2 [Patella vulgata]XP_055958365.1 cadherin EGF LAG seven-pass G-type receptor 2 [Patella vulgata]